MLIEAAAGEALSAVGVELERVSLVGVDGTDEQDSQGS
jgi:hypothetical protein